MDLTTSYLARAAGLSSSDKKEAENASKAIADRTIKMLDQSIDVKHFEENALLLLLMRSVVQFQAKQELNYRSAAGGIVREDYIKFGKLEEDDDSENHKESIRVVDIDDAIGAGVPEDEAVLDWRNDVYR